MKNTKTNRRNFFKTCARYLSFGAITFTGVKLVSRKPNPKLQNQVCINNSICKNCNTFSKCELPRALSIKKFFRNNSQVKNG